MKLSSLTPTDKDKLAAELDGWKPSEFDSWWKSNHKPYGTSYDAIIPLIQKQPKEIQWQVCVQFMQEHQGFDDDLLGLLNATPSQLRDALLVAAGKATL